MIFDRVGDQLQLYIYGATDTSVLLTIMLGQIIYDLSLALARGGASVSAFQKRSLIASQLRHLEFWNVTYMVILSTISHLVIELLTLN